MKLVAMNIYNVFRKVSRNKSNRERKLWYELSLIKGCAILVKNARNE